MKKAILIILPLILIIAIIFTVVIFTSPKTELSFDEPIEEIKDKIEQAVLNNGFDLYCDLYADEISKQQIIKPEKSIDNINLVSCDTCINGNYLVTFSCHKNTVYTGITSKELGRYELDLYITYGYAIYITDEDKLISLYDAYDNGMLSNKELKALYSYNEEYRKRNNTSIIPFNTITKK